MTHLDTNGWPPHARALSGQISGLGERMARIETKVENIADRMEDLPCGAQGAEIATLRTGLAVNQTKLGIVSTIFGVLGGALAALLAWFLRSPK